MYGLMKEFRCTRSYPYRDPGCPGNTNTSARNGHYIQAHTEGEALFEMSQRYPEDVERGYKFSVELWKTNAQTPQDCECADCRQYRIEMHEADIADKAASEKYGF